jgi:hypothetical protein
LARLEASQNSLKSQEFIARENRLSRESIAGIQAAATAAYKEATLAEQKRQHDIQDAAARRTLYARATEKHPGYKTLQELQQSIADMQSRPDLTIDQQKNLQAKITQHNALQAAIHTAADTAAQREFGAGGGGYSNFRQGQ